MCLLPMASSAGPRHVLPCMSSPANPLPHVLLCLACVQVKGKIDDVFNQVQGDNLLACNDVTFLANNCPAAQPSSVLFSAAGHVLNSGLMAFKPSMDTYEQMVKLMQAGVNQQDGSPLDGGELPSSDAQPLASTYKAALRLTCMHLLMCVHSGDQQIVFLQYRQKWQQIPHMYNAPTNICQCEKAWDQGIKVICVHWPQSCCE